MDILSQSQPDNDNDMGSSFGSEKTKKQRRIFFWTTVKSCFKNALNQKRKKRSSQDSPNSDLDLKGVVLLQGYGPLKHVDESLNLEDAKRDAVSGSLHEMASGSSTTLRSYNSRISLNQAALSENTNHSSVNGEELLPDAFQIENEYPYGQGFSHSYVHSEAGEPGYLYYNNENVANYNFCENDPPTLHSVSSTLNSTVMREPLNIIHEETSPSTEAMNIVAVPVPLSFVHDQELHKYVQSPVASAKSGPANPDDVPLTENLLADRSASPSDSVNSSLVPVPINLSNSVGAESNNLFRAVAPDYILDPLHWCANPC